MTEKGTLEPWNWKTFPKSALPSQVKETNFTLNGQLQEKISHILNKAMKMCQKEMPTK